MTYRKRNKCSAKLAAMRLAAEQSRMANPAPDYIPRVPALRRTIIVIDHDFGDVEHRLDLFRTNRIDCYRVVADGVEWKSRAGWSSILEALRKSFIRVGAQASA